MMNWKFQDIKMHLFLGECKEILMKKDSACVAAYGVVGGEK